MLTASLLLWSAAATEAFAQDPGQEQPQSLILNEQFQSADVLAEQELIVEEAVEGVAATTSAVGNSVGAEVQHQNLDFRSTQHLGGAVTADAYVQSQGTSGEAFLSSVQATGNTGHASTCCGYLPADVKQTIGAHSGAEAKSYAAAGGPVVDAASAATALGNSQTYAAVNGNVDARTVQTHNGFTNAYNQSVFCCITGSGQFASTAVSNSLVSEVEGGNGIHLVDQTMDGFETRATNEVYVVTGNMVAGAATATANTTVVGNTDGYAELDSVQINQSLVEAENQVQLDTWYGIGSASAYGVGNTVHLSSLSAEAVMRTDQLNNGDVNSYSTFRGGYGEHLVNSATSIGNSASGLACGNCDGVLDATNRQENNGAIRASARTYTGHSHFVTGSATAVGNSASYESSRSGGR